MSSFLHSILLFARANGVLWNMPGRTFSILCRIGNFSLTTPFLYLCLRHTPLFCRFFRSHIGHNINLSLFRLLARRYKRVAICYYNSIALCLSSALLVKLIVKGGV